MFTVTVAAGRLEVETPDHVLLRYDLAGAGNRGFAALLDFTIVLVIVVTMVFVLAGLAVLTGDAFVSLGAVLILSVALIDALCVSPFGESASQVRFINSLALRKRKEMTALEENSSRVAKSRQTKEQLTANNSSSASSRNRQRN